MARRRIRRPKEQEDLYKSLTDNDEFGIFNSYKDIFMLAGTVGYLENKRKEFSSNAEGMSWSVFNLETDEAIINAVALADTKDPEILNVDDETFDKKIKIFEEFAAGGLDVVFKKIMDNPKNAVNNYFDYILSMETEVSEKERNLKGIADMLF